MPDVFHRIYTHAPLDASDTTGGRVVSLGELDAARVLDPRALQELDELLRKTTPAGHETAWVVRRFGSIACVIASYPDLITDAADRSGDLNHARLAPSLVVVADEPEKQQLAEYLDRVSDGKAAALADPPRTLLRDVLVACLDNMGRRKAVRFRVPKCDIASLAAAWSALPIGLQRSSSFALDVADGCPVDVIFSDSSGRSAVDVRAALRDCVDRYLALLLDKGHDLRNSDIATVEKLDEAVRKASVKQPKKHEDPGPLDPEIVAELQRQYDAMQASLQDYVRQRLALVEPRQPAAAAAPAGGMPRWLPWAVSAALLALVLWLAAQRWLFRPEEPAFVQTTTTAAEEPVVETTESRPAISRDRQILRDALARGKFADELKALMTDHAALAAQPIQIAANGNMSSAAAETLEKFARAIEAKRDLGSDGRAALRKWLLDVIAANVAAETGAIPPKIDGNLADISAPLLEDVKAKYRVTTPANAQGQEFQSEVILRWMESQTP